MRATQQTCDCSSEKEMMKRELEEASSIIDHLEDEVKRLHDDKQSLLLSFLNLQAASRSREPSRTGTDGSGSEVEDSGEESDAEDESEDDDVMCEDSDVSDEEEDEVGTFYCSLIFQLRNFWGDSPLASPIAPPLWCPFDLVKYYFPCFVFL